MAERRSERNSERQHESIFTNLAIVEYSLHACQCVTRSLRMRLVIANMIGLLVQQDCLSVWCAGQTDTALGKLPKHVGNICGGLRHAVLALRMQAIVWLTDAVGKDWVSHELKCFAEITARSLPGDHVVQ